MRGVGFRFLKPVFGAFAFTVLLCASAQAASYAEVAEKEECDSYPEISVEVVTSFNEAQIDNAASLKDLQALARKKEMIMPRYEPVALGLTAYTPKLTSFSPIAKRVMPDGSFCARARYLEVSVGYDNATIYVAKEYREGSCSYDVILGHERKHIATYRQLLEEYAPKIKNRLAHYLRDNGVSIVSDEGYSEKLLKGKIDSFIKEISVEISKENERRQKLVDTPEEYERNNSACKGYISKKVMDYYSGD